MLTPKQLKELSDIIVDEQNRLILQNPSEKQLGDYFKLEENLEKSYFKQAIAGNPVALTKTIRISANESLEALEVKEPRYQAKRLVSKTTFRIVLRAIKLQIPITIRTKEWLQTSIMADDFRQEAEKVSALG